MALVDRLLKKVPQYTRNERHLYSVIHHGNLRKWANLLRVEWERKRRRTRLRSRPYLLILDPCNYCNLRCPLCPTGVKQLGREQSMLSFEHFRHYFDPHIPYLFEVYMHNWGESLINKEVYRMIEYAQAHGVGTNLSSNLVILDSDDIDRLLDSGLEYLVVSLDGTTPETYLQYRVRGDYERVITNLREIIRRRNERGLKTPVVEWQFIVMKQNEHEIPEAERLAAEIGVDKLRFIPVGMPYEFEDRKETADRWYPTGVSGRVESSHEEQQFGQADKPGPCFYLYRSMVVNPDGGVSPCCVVYQKNRDFAQLDPAAPVDIEALWNNEHYRSARALYGRQRPEGEHVATVCDGCDIFSRPHWSQVRKQRPIAVTEVQVPAVACKEEGGGSES